MFQCFTGPNKHYCCSKIFCDGAMTISVSIGSTHDLCGVSAMSTVITASETPLYLSQRVKTWFIQADFLLSLCMKPNQTFKCQQRQESVFYMFFLIEHHLNRQKNQTIYNILIIGSTYWTGFSFFVNIDSVCSHNVPGSYIYWYSDPLSSKLWSWNTIPGSPGRVTC